MAAEKVGTCNCPICKQPGADVKFGARKKHFINCDQCCTVVTTLSRAGDDAIKAMMVTAAAPAPAPAPAVSDQAKAVAAASQEKPAQKKSRGALGDAVAMLTGAK